MVLGVLSGSLTLHDSAQVCMDHLVCRQVRVTFMGLLGLSQVWYNSSHFQKALSVQMQKCSTGPRRKFQNIQQAQDKQSPVLSVSKGLDDSTVFITEDAGAPVLDPKVVSHLVLINLHSLRPFGCHSRP